MAFIEPMYAAPLPKNFNPRSGEWMAEEKYDGERIVVEVGEGMTDLLSEGHPISAWSRYGRSRVLPRHITEILEMMPPGVYDGELMVPGGRSYGVKELVNQSKLVYVIFDVLQLGNRSTIELTYTNRRQLLWMMKAHGWLQLEHTHASVVLANAHPVNDITDVHRLRDAVWARDGEGLILKNVNARYHSGKRPKEAFLKIKQLRTAVLKVRGFLPSKGKLVDRGEFAIVILEDKEGNQTQVKTLNDKELTRFEKEAKHWAAIRNDGRTHPAIGRELRIEYQERTPDGGYRHPRWDRWENE